MEKDYQRESEIYGSVKAMAEELDDTELLDCYEQLNRSPEIIIEMVRRGLPTPLDFGD